MSPVMSYRFCRTVNSFYFAARFNYRDFLNTLTHVDVSVVGPEMVFDKLFNHIGFNVIPPLFVQAFSDCQVSIPPYANLKQAIIYTSFKVSV